MQFQQLELIKLKHPSLSSSIDSLASYISSEIDEGRTRIVPALASTFMKRSEAEVTALLMVFEDAGLIDHEFDIVCTAKNSVLLSVPDLSKFDDLLPIQCRLCDSEHDPEGLRVELVFEVKSGQDFKQHAA